MADQRGAAVGFRSTIASRLGLLLLVSLAGLFFFGLTTARNERNSANVAGQLAQQAELVELLSSASVQLEVQADSIQGVEQAAAMGVELASLAPLIGGPSALEAYESNGSMDLLLDDIAATPSNLWADRASVERVLQGRDAFAATPAEAETVAPAIGSTRSDLSAALAKALAAQTLRLNTFVGRAEVEPELAAAANARESSIRLLATAAAERQALADYLLPLTERTEAQNYRRLITAHAHYDNAMATLRSQLSKEDLAELDEALDTTADERYSTLLDQAISGEVRAEPEVDDLLALVPTGLTIFVQGFDRIRDLLAFDRALSADFTAEALALESESEARSRSVAAWSLGFSFLVVALSIVTVRSITVPVQALLHRARNITEGDLETEGPASGPRDIGMVHQALDDMSANLRTLSQQAEALSEGRLDDEVLERNVAGPLGTSVHGSVDRLRSMTARLEYQATHDSLTGLPNRAAVMSFLDVCLTGRVADRTPLAVVMLDLDGFKQINDDFGHVVGDELLIHVADRLRRRADGELVARLGGDEFMILVVGERCQEIAEQLATSCVHSISGPTSVSVGQVRVASSAGIAATGVDGWLTPTELLRRVDLALYEAKAGDEEIVLFDQTLHDSLLESTRLQAEIHRALECDEFNLALQPIMSIDNGEVAGYEALIRWDSPTRGMVAPDLFIPTAEQSDLIDRVDTWVLNRGGSILKEWQNDRTTDSLTLSVNVSARHLSNPCLVGTVADVIQRHGLDSRQLLLEVTESQLIPNLARAENTLRGLRALGVRLAIDDFGTGYSSVAHLRRVKFDRIKIDRSFLAHLDDETDRSLASLLVSLGRDLELEVVAEGIETEAQLEWAVRAGCTHVQGYLLGRPGPAVLPEPPKLQLATQAVTDR